MDGRGKSLPDSSKTNASLSCYTSWTINQNWKTNASVPCKTTRPISNISKTSGPLLSKASRTIPKRCKNSASDCHSPATSRLVGIEVVAFQERKSSAKIFVDVARGQGVTGKKGRQL
ncbi:hypothetical protein H6P81_006488 [Aristolochia fimbriata]|uniref:Uncharacterized protein n=1 Tax=Aristolochia fimbriata TaxID=158543 RepID=A0AAV7EYD7_ARIFI|nr:hypothetical protein H6P81_006488 [Aristolochia fimbriata]